MYVRPCRLQPSRVTDGSTMNEGKKCRNAEKHIFRHFRNRGHHSFRVPQSRELRVRTTEAHQTSIHRRERCSRERGERQREKREGGRRVYFYYYRRVPLPHSLSLPINGPTAITDREREGERTIDKIASYILLPPLSMHVPSGMVMDIFYIGRAASGLSHGC